MIKFLLIFIFFIQLNVFAMDSFHGLDATKQNVIDASTNARGHSNMGNIYFSQGNYISAITEYKIAYALSYDSPISSTYLYNIAKCYYLLGYSKNAKIFFEEAIKKDCLNLTYYQGLVDSYIALGIEKKELKKHLSDNSNPYNRIVAGLIYLKTGNKLSAKNIFDEFINNNPDMLISKDIEAILKNL